MRRLVKGTVCLLALLAGAPGWGGRPLSAADQLVYRPWVNNGTEYRRIPYPPQAGPLVVLAGTAMALEAQYAPVNYWPITREYLADFSGEPRVVGGRFELTAPGGEEIFPEETPIVLWYPQGVGAGPSSLEHGPRALALYQEYLETARASAEAIRAYQQAVAEAQAAAEGWLRMKAEGRENLPPPPPELTLPEPEPYQAYASEPRPAALLALPEGRYTLRIRDAAGGIVPGSERQVISFAPLDHAVGYVVRPADRWTQPVFNFARDEAIYTTGHTDLYLQPVPIVSYPAHHYARLFQPQTLEADDATRTLWVPAPQAEGPAPSYSLALWDGGRRTGTVPMVPYRVEQVPNQALGYRIKEFHPEPGVPLQADFQAVRVPAGAALTHVSLLENPGEKPVPASRRALRQVHPPGDGVLFLPALLPLVFYLLLRGWVRRQRAGRSQATPG